MSSHVEKTFTAFGYTGGALLAICMLPQLRKMYIMQSADDVSVRFLLLYCVGLSMTLAYLLYEDATAAWIPAIVDISFALCTLVYKLYLDRKRRRQKVQYHHDQQLIHLTPACLPHQPTTGSKESCVDGKLFETGCVHCRLHRAAAADSPNNAAAQSALIGGAHMSSNSAPDVESGVLLAKRVEW